MSRSGLGKVYEDGTLVIRQGDPGYVMYVVQQGKLDVLIKKDEAYMKIAELKEGDIFGEMALFTKEARSASVRANGNARVMTIDKRGFFKRVHEDPTLAFNMLQKMSERIRHLNDEVARNKTHEVS
jgi:CRP-like cAMP-binding protein